MDNFENISSILKNIRPLFKTRTIRGLLQKDQFGSLVGMVGQENIKIVGKKIFISPVAKEILLMRAELRSTKNLIGQEVADAQKVLKASKFLLGESSEERFETGSEEEDVKPSEETSESCCQDQYGLQQLKEIIVAQKKNIDFLKNLVLVLKTNTFAERH